MDLPTCRRYSFSNATSEPATAAATSARSSATLTRLLQIDHVGRLSQNHTSESSSAPWAGAQSYPSAGGWLARKAAPYRLRCTGDRKGLTQGVSGSLARASLEVIQGQPEQGPEPDIQDFASIWNIGEWLLGAVAASRSAAVLPTKTYSVGTSSE